MYSYFENNNTGVFSLFSVLFLVFQCDRLILFPTSNTNNTTEIHNYMADRCVRYGSNTNGVQ